MCKQVKQTAGNMGVLQLSPFAAFSCAVMHGPFLLSCVVMLGRVGGRPVIATSCICRGYNATKLLPVNGIMRKLTRAPSNGEQHQQCRR